MKAAVAAFNQEEALVGAFSVITNLRMELFEALLSIVHVPRVTPRVMAGELGRGGHHPPLPLLQRVPEPRVPQAEGGARPSIAPGIIHVSGHHCNNLNAE